MLRLLGSLRGLRIQLLLWTVLPLTLVLIGITLFGISIHQGSMRAMVEELDARSARLAASHLSDELATRVALLDIIATDPTLPLADLSLFFDGGSARFDPSGRPVDAFPSVKVWRARPVAELLSLEFSSQILQDINPEQIADKALFSPLFVDPLSGRTYLLIGLKAVNSELVVGAVSLEQLGVIEIVTKAHFPDPRNGTEIAKEDTMAMDGVVAFLVDAQGQVIYHPNAALVGQDFKKHEGVAAVTRGETGATYHREPDGQELAVGYAPIIGPGWGLIVQEPWEALIAPTMRFSLLTPLTVVAAALISALAVTFGLHYIVRPLQSLDRQATQVAWGDFAAVSEPVGGIQEIEDLRRTLANMAHQIQRYQGGMRDYIVAVTMAQEEERKRLARELHDETVQSLIALGHRVEMVQKALDKDPERARQRLAELSGLVNETQQEVRRFSRALRPLYLEDLGLVPAVEILAQEVERQSGLTISLRIEGTVRRLTPDLELTAYRIAQEGLSNVARHAQAQNVWLTLGFAADGLTLWLQDNGVGFEPPINPADLASQGHFGLMGIHERALLFGGRLEIHSKPGEGTTLEVFLSPPDLKK